MTSSQPIDPTVEPWLRGPIPGVHPAIAPVLHSFIQVREDLERHTAGLSTEQVWRRVGAVPALGFQLRHLAGSVDRLVTYLRGDQLSEAQIATLKNETKSETKSEAEPGASLDELLVGVRAALDDAAARVRSLDPATLEQARFVGKKRLPTTVIGLLVHVAEHTQRHLGQAITTAKLVREAAD
ncbi:MAG TPA: DinB family protein [Bryobacteraceae bacterium]|nr:DinB family protein [Bryobacteraceae bacterium]